MNQQPNPSPEDVVRQMANQIINPPDHQALSPEQNAQNFSNQMGAQGLEGPTAQEMLNLQTAQSPAPEQPEEHSNEKSEKSRRFRSETEKLKKKLEMESQRSADKEYEAYLLRQERDQLAAQLERERNIKESLEGYQTELYNHTLDLEEHNIKSKLKEAHLDGDADAIVEYQNRLSKLNAKREAYRVESSLSEIVAPSNQQAPSRDSYAPPPSQPSQSQEALNDWLMDNPWADESSPEFNPSLLKDAILLKDALEKRLSLEGNGQWIGTREFYDEVTNMIKANYGINQPAPQQQQPYPQYQQPYPQQPAYPQYQQPMQQPVPQQYNQGGQVNWNMQPQYQPPGSIVQRSNVAGWQPQQPPAPTPNWGRGVAPVPGTWDANPNAQYAPRLSAREQLSPLEQQISDNLPLDPHPNGRPRSLEEKAQAYLEQKMNGPHVANTETQVLYGPQAQPYGYR